MASRSEVFCRVVELGSFTRTAEDLGYSQSSVSQTVRALEQELGVILLDRSRDGLSLTADGEQFYPYLRSIRAAEQALELKKREMEGLEHSTVTIGTFTAVSRNLLPGVLREFKEQWPEVQFVLRQGEYTSISSWIRDGSVDLGFISAGYDAGLEERVLMSDELQAVLPPRHPLVGKEEVSLTDLAQEPFILLDEGADSLVTAAFTRLSLKPRIEYTVTDDYSILAMVRQGLGLSALYQMVVSGFEEAIAVRPIIERPERQIALAWRRWDTLSLAARRFAEFLLEKKGRGARGD